MRRRRERDVSSWWVWAVVGWQWPSWWVWRIGVRMEEYKRLKKRRRRERGGCKYVMMYNGLVFGGGIGWFAKPKI